MKAATQTTESLAAIASSAVRVGDVFEARSTNGKATRTATDEQLAAIASTAWREGDVFKVPSSKGKTTYTVTALSCSCGDWINRKAATGEHCKHQEAVALLCPAPTPKPYEGDPWKGFD